MRSRGENQVQMSVLIQRSAWGLALIIGAFSLWLAAASLKWPLLGDATVFHFAGRQFLLGATPYRDFIDMNMPLIYAIHAAIIAIGGTGDFAFRVFDLSAVVAAGALAAALVWPAGRAYGVLAAVAVMSLHLLFGPASAGQRDFLMLIPLLGAAICSARAVEKPERAFGFLAAAGALAVLAALLKPLGALSILLPLAAGAYRPRDLLAVAAGGAVTGGAALAILAAMGALGPFIAALTIYAPTYASADPESLPRLVLSLAQNVARIGSGLALAAVFGAFAVRSPRARVMLALIVIGALSYFVQRKGYFYHTYPFIAAMLCLGAYALPRMIAPVALAALVFFAGTFGVRAMNAFERADIAADALPPVEASRAMQQALSTHLQAGARVQLLDTDAGGFLAMARAGMRQATPHAYWMFLNFGRSDWREAFIAQLEAAPPAAVLVTDSEWPLPDGFFGVDDWPAFRSFLSTQYDLVENRSIEEAPTPWTGGFTKSSWRLYVLKGASSPTP